MNVSPTGWRAGPIVGTILPEYAGRGLANVVPTIERHFGVVTELEPLSAEILPPILLEGVDCIVTLVIDALGYNQLRTAMDGGHAPHISALLDRPASRLIALTSIFPSTTVTALTTLGSGLPPSRHGVISQVFFDAALGATVDILPFAPVVAGRGLEQSGIEPSAWLGLPTVHEKLAGMGVASIVVNHAQFEGTSLSRINHTGACFVSFLTISDLCTNLRAAVEARKGPTCIHSYWGTLDSIAHLYGVGSPQHNAEIRVLDFAIGNLLLAGLHSPRTLLLILADHGQLNCSRERVVWLNNHPDLLELLQSPPAGLDRASVLYVRSGYEDDARRYVEDSLGAEAHALTAEESVALGLYGPEPISERARQRMGQLLLLPRENWRLKYNPPGKERLVWSVGNHGGLTPEEMLIPLLALRLD